MSFLVELPLELYAPDAFADFHPSADFHLGTARCTFYTCDLTY